MADVWLLIKCWLKNGVFCSMLDIQNKESEGKDWNKNARRYRGMTLKVAFEICNYVWFYSYQFVKCLSLCIFVSNLALSLSVATEGGPKNSLSWTMVLSQSSLTRITWFNIFELYPLHIHHITINVGYLSVNDDGPDFICIQKDYSRTSIDQGNRGEKDPLRWNHG